MRDFRRLEVWICAHRFALNVHEQTQDFPKTEIYGITNQIRRAALSIPSNIAEGCGRSSAADFARFLDIALGSAKEADYQLLFCKDLGYLSARAYNQLANEATSIQKMLSTLILTLRRSG